MDMDKDKNKDGPNMDKDKDGLNMDKDKDGPNKDKDMDKDKAQDSHLQYQRGQRGWG